jgi:nitrogen fixation protein NifU and related proteins
VTSSPYGDLIHEHARHPRNYGPLEEPQIRNEGDNPLCGDRVRIEVSIAPDDTVRAAGFQGDLCMIGKAAGSLLTEMITGLSLDRVAEIQEQQMIEALDAEIKPSRRRCALLPFEVLQSGVSVYRDLRRVK